MATKSSLLRDILQSCNFAFDIFGSFSVVPGKTKKRFSCFLQQLHGKSSPSAPSSEKCTSDTHEAHPETATPSRVSPHVTHPTGKSPIWQITEALQKGYYIAHEYTFSLFASLICQGGRLPRVPQNKPGKAMNA